MILCDAEIRDELTQYIEPWNEEQLQPASYDVLLGAEILVPRKKFFGAFIDPENPPQEYTSYNLMKQDLLISPGQFMLGCTVEKITVPRNMVATLDGKSSRGRIGLIVHSTAGYIDPAFEGRITLEMYNLNKTPIKLHYGMRIGQLRFQRMSREAEVPYGPARKSRYHGQTSTQIAKPEQV